MLRTSWGKLVSKVYRLHITCRAGHHTYTDYATVKAARTNLAKMTNRMGWYATHIEVKE